QFGAKRTRKHTVLIRQFLLDVCGLKNLMLSCVPTRQRVRTSSTCQRPPNRRLQNFISKVILGSAGAAILLGPFSDRNEAHSLRPHSGRNAAAYRPDRADAP